MEEGESSRLRLRLSTTQIIRAVAIVAAATYLPSKDHAPSKPVSIGEGEGVLSHFVCALLYTRLNFNNAPSTPPFFFFFFLKKGIASSQTLKEGGTH